MRITDTACGFVGIREYGGRKEEYFFLITVGGFYFNLLSYFKQAYYNMFDGVEDKDFSLKWIEESGDKAACHVFATANLKDLRQIIGYGIDDAPIYVDFKDERFGDSESTAYVSGILEGITVMINMKTGKMYTVPDILSNWNNLVNSINKEDTVPNRAKICRVCGSRFLSTGECSNASCSTVSEQSLSETIEEGITSGEIIPQMCNMSSR